MSTYKLFTLQNIQAANFLMTPLELKDYLNFDVKRIYFISSPQAANNTGTHAHRQDEDEIFIQVQGSCTIIVDDGSGMQEIMLHGPQNAIYVPHMVWHGFKDMSDDSIICAVTSTNYDPSRADYIEDYDEFKKKRTSRMKNTILMTGASGLVGSRFEEMFGDEYQVANIDVTNNVNILDPQSIKSFVQENNAPTLVHLAAFTNTAEAFKQTGDKEGSCYQVNVAGTRNIAAICRDAGIHMIHVSTDFVFDGTKKELYTEEDPRAPIEWYGQTKAWAEEEVEKSGVDYSIVRIAYPYRSGYTLKPDIVTKIKEGLQSGSFPPQFTDTTITPTFVDDIMQAFRTIAMGHKTGIYHVVGSTVLSPYDLSVAVASRFDLDHTKIAKGSLADYLKANPRPFSQYSGISNAKAARELGLHFATIEEGLKQLS